MSCQNHLPLNSCLENLENYYIDTTVGRYGERTYIDKWQDNLYHEMVKEVNGEIATIWDMAKFQNVM